ncbi:MAG: DUF1549 and DUF1553 domain-containing protein, partial [Phycisphaerae bacterium]|nr:DUF1549 and DUF1553 domain-containing protein [Phycisphaerae bacterium]
RFDLFPPKVNLSTARDRQSLVAQVTMDNGITRDVTGEVKFQIADAKLLRREGQVLYPLADGVTEVVVHLGERTVKVPVTVSDVAAKPPVSFRLDVVPAFTKAGCNTGSCHGSSRGKDGFNLSLFGYDPAGDYHRITREQIGRRINLAVPSASLLLEKATGAVTHTGGELFQSSSPLYQTLLRWLEAGAPDDPADIARATSIEIFPKSMVLNGKNTTQRLTVVASYSDGRTRDVTALAAFSSNNDRSAAISPQGLVTADHRGEAFVMARFDAYTVGSQVIVLPKDAKLDWPDVPEHNYVDTLVNQKLKKLRIVPSEICSDEIFLRRVYIDVTGKLPSEPEYQRFIADKDPKKREKLVDVLLDRKEFTELWVMKFAELLQIRSDGNINRGISYKASVLYYNWLQEKIANNVPMDQIVQELLGSTGGTFATPTTNFYQIERDTKKLTENIAQVFMGMRIQCAQCHNHPFDRWTMDDYYSFVSFFTQVGRKQAEDPRETIVYNRGSGELNHPVHKKPMPPKFLGGNVAEVKGKDRRAIAARWLASPENPYFARNLANIVWAHFLGRGIVEPVDDVRISNPAVNPELLDELGRRFTDYKYDFKRLVRDICLSRTYQLSTQTNPTNLTDGTNFSRAYVRRQRAEVLYDVISQVTETMEQNKFRGLPKGARAVQIADGRTSTFFLKTFGRATRDTVCSCEVSMEPNLSQALHLLNGQTVGGKIRSGNVVANMLKKHMTGEQIIDSLYLRCLSRRPTDVEKLHLLDRVKDAEDQREAYEDVFWALLNSKEFLFNH